MNKKEQSGGMILGNLLGTFALIGTGIYLYKSQKGAKYVLVGSLVGGLCGFLLGNAIHKFYTYDQQYVIYT
jgi:hypothetical protein